MHGRVVLAVQNAGLPGSQFAAGLVLAGDWASAALVSPQGQAGVHAEPWITARIADLVEQVTAGGRVPTEVQVYSYKSPCQDCTVNLRGLIAHAGQLNIGTWRFGWSEHWVPDDLYATVNQRQNEVAALQASVNNGSAALPRARAARDQAQFWLNRLHANQPINAQGAPASVLEGIQLLNQRQNEFADAQMVLGADEAVLAHRRQQLVAAQQAVADHIAQQNQNLADLAAAQGEVVGVWAVEQV